MHFVATLVSNPAEPAVTLELADEIAGNLPLGRRETWLATHVAIDIAFEADLDGDPSLEPAAAGTAEQMVISSATKRIRTIIGGLPIDVIVQRRDEHRRKKLLVADMDSTIIGQECIDELADFAGLKTHVAAITERAMRGEIAFEPALRERVALLRGLDSRIIGTILAERISLTPGAKTLVETMRAHGAQTVLVSGGFSLFTSKVAAWTGFHENRANLLGLENGLLTGMVCEPILGREAKLATLRELRVRHDLAEIETLAIGDGANDLAMLKEAGLGLAFHAKPAVAAAAHARIDHGDLTAALYVQGYRGEEFAA